MRVLRLVAVVARVAGFLQFILAQGRWQGTHRCARSVKHPTLRWAAHPGHRLRARGAPAGRFLVSGVGAREVPCCAVLCVHFEQYSWSLLRAGSFFLRSAAPRPATPTRNFGS